MNWNNLSLIVLGLVAFFSAFTVALWISLVIWTFRDMRARTRDAFAQLLVAAMVLILGPLGTILYLMLRPRETLAEKYERSLEEEALLQDIEERTICPACKQPIENDFMVCPVCHTKLRQHCAHCDRLIHPRWSVCPYCGKTQAPIPGANRAGRVTLLDLETPQMGETPRPAQEPSAGPPAIKPGPVVEAASTSASIQAQTAPEQTTGEHDLAQAEYATPLEPEWEDLDVEPLQDESEPQDFVDELDDLDADVLQQTQEPQDQEEKQDLLSSLFKRH
ncbi:MAG: zinc ribbon domain-containing protein [Anaerolineae bacterium]|nr:zinc ribbon domain-containing protein [Anaerolineae bacterium]